MDMSTGLAELRCQAGVLRCRLRLPLLEGAPVAQDDLMLRDVIEEDLPIFFEQQQEPEANRMAAFPARAWDAFMAHWRTKVLGDVRAQKKAIVVVGKVAGNVGSWEQDGQRLIGYWLGRSYWGRGIATAALREFLKLETTRPLYAHVAVDNLGSIRVLEKCGFRAVDDSTEEAVGPEELLLRLDG
jgi:RimJ/RimL family protein N-acetyltransferase